MMKKCMLTVLVALLLLGAVPGLADTSSGQPTGTVVATSAAVFDGIGANAKPIGDLQSGEGVIVLQNQGEWLQVFSRAQRLVGWVTAGAVRIDYSSPIYPGIVISQNVSLREGPSTGAARIASVPNGSIFDLLDEQNDWYRVAYFDSKTSQMLEGWVLVDYIVRDPSYVTTTKLTYVYSMPARDSKKVGQLVSGTQLVVIGEYGDFWVVNLRSASGFIYKNDIEEDVYWNGGNG